jgi:Cu/Ag efflux protein CusF
MRKVLLTGVAVSLLVCTAAWAGDVTGKIQSVDPTEKTVTLDDGTKIWVGDAIDMDKLKEGSEVKASYEEKDGKNVATSVEVKE